MLSKSLKIIETRAFRAINKFYSQSRPWSRIDAVACRTQVRGLPNHLAIAHSCPALLIRIARKNTTIINFQTAKRPQL